MNNKSINSESRNTSNAALNAINKKKINQNKHSDHHLNYNGYEAVSSNELNNILYNDNNLNNHNYKIGLITKRYGYTFVIDNFYFAITKGKSSDRYTVGDIVEFEVINTVCKNNVKHIANAIITNLHSRKNLIKRSSDHKTKLIASNIDQLIIVVSNPPHYCSNFLNRCLLVAESEKIQPIIVINKVDLPSARALYEEIYKTYSSIGYNVISLSAITLDNHGSVGSDLHALINLIKNKINLILGQSGVGKSTIINLLANYQQLSAKQKKINKNHTNLHIDNLQYLAKTAALSAMMSKYGLHTTTNSIMYDILINNCTARIIDCPGIQDFGLDHLTINSLSGYFPDFANISNRCKFNNCKHINEPECMINNALKIGAINYDRFDFYLAMRRELTRHINY